jgi:hypothetical protein
MFAGKVDFYYWKGKPVARRWPKKPTGPPTAAVAQARAIFAETNRQIGTITKPEKRLWRAFVTAKNTAWFDHVKRDWYALIKNGDFQRIPYFQTLTYSPVIPAPNASLFVTFQPDPSILHPTPSVRYVTGDTPDLYPRWYHSHTRNERGRRFVPIYYPSVAGWKQANFSSWTPNLGFARWTIPERAPWLAFYLTPRDPPSSGRMLTPLYIVQAT